MRLIFTKEMQARINENEEKCNKDVSEMLGQISRMRRMIDSIKSDSKKSFNNVIIEAAKDVMLYKLGDHAIDLDGGTDFLVEEIIVDNLKAMPNANAKGFRFVYLGSELTKKLTPRADGQKGYTTQDIIFEVEK